MAKRKNNNQAEMKGQGDAADRKGQGQTDEVKIQKGNDGTKPNVDDTNELNRLTPHSAPPMFATTLSNVPDVFDDVAYDSGALSELTTHLAQVYHSRLVINRSGVRVNQAVALYYLISAMYMACAIKLSLSMNNSYPAESASILKSLRKFTVRLPEGLASCVRTFGEVDHFGRRLRVAGGPFVAWSYALKATVAPIGANPPIVAAEAMHIRSDMVSLIPSMNEYYGAKVHGWIQVAHPRVTVNGVTIDVPQNPDNWGQFRQLLLLNYPSVGAAGGEPDVNHPIPDDVALAIRVLALMQGVNAFNNVIIAGLQPLGVIVEDVNNEQFNQRYFLFSNQFRGIESSLSGLGLVNVELMDTHGDILHTFAYPEDNVIRGPYSLTPTQRELAIIMGMENYTALKYNHFQVTSSFVAGQAQHRYVGLMFD